MIRERLSISGALMTHPTREKQARQFADEHRDLNLAVVVDPDPTAGRSTLRTSRAAWAAAPPDSTHHFVLQDDLVLRPGFARSLASAVESRPADALALFTHWSSRTAQAVRLAALTGRRWVPCLDAYVPTQALVLPAEVGREFARAAARFRDDVPDNWAVRLFLDHVGVEALVTTPNLVDHDVADSLLGNDIFLGPRRSATPVAHPQAWDPVAFDNRVCTPLAMPHADSAGSLVFVTFPQRAAAGGPNALSFLAEAGMTSEQVESGFQADLAATGLEHSRYAIPTMAQLWLSAFLLGLISAHEVGATAGDQIEAVRSDKIADAAIGTLAPGLLARTVDVSALDRVAAELGPLCRAAVLSGGRSMASVPALADLSGAVDRSSRLPAQLQAELRLSAVTPPADEAGRLT
jgi:hypothetical protein